MNCAVMPYALKNSVSTTVSDDAESLLHYEMDCDLSKSAEI